MAVAAWAANTAYGLGDVRRATSSQVTGLFFKVSALAETGPNTSASTEPDWPTDIGQTVIDNGVTWTAISSVYADLSILAPSAIIELFEIRLDPSLHGSDDILEFHNGCNAQLAGGILWNGKTYESMSIQIEGLEQSTSGTLPRPTLTMANTNRAITAILNDVNVLTPGNDLTGAEFRRIRTLKKFLDGETTADPNAQWPLEIWYIDRKALENREMVEFELASKFDLAGQKVPRRQLIANVCQWGYRSTECSYQGSAYWNANDVAVSSASEDKCGKRISSCKLRFGSNGELPYGSFPSAGRLK